MSDEHLSGRDAARAPDYRHVVEHIQGAVVELEFVDGDPIVRDVNEAFVDVFGYAAADVVGESLNDRIVPDWRRDEAERTTRGGFALYTDLTELSRNRRRVRVLNRVLRHNLRNRATVVLGHTTTLLDAVDERTDEHVAAAAAVERAARDLERLAAEAGDVRRLLDGSNAGDTVDVVPLVRRVVAGETDVTPTRHASGLGLWLVAWAAETFGGDLSFAESDLGGNLVRVRLPAV